MTIPTPQVDCWDYTFDKKSTDQVWIAKAGSDGSTVACYTSHNFWQFILIADSEAQLRQEISALSNMDGTDVDFGDMTFDKVSMSDILGDWRFMRYLGRNVCAFDLTDITPVSSQSFPGGPPAPVRNAFIYLCYDRKTGKPIGKKIGDDVIPYAQPSIASLIATISEEFSIPTEQLVVNYIIVAANALSASMEHPLVYWWGKLLPLHDMMLVNPNHSPEDAEETLLGKID